MKVDVYQCTPNTSRFLMFSAGTDLNKFQFPSSERGPLKLKLIKAQYDALESDVANQIAQNGYAIVTGKVFVAVKLGS
jgi:hypothetical protein